MFITDTLGPYIGVFIEWGFLMAFLYNLVSYLNNPDKKLVQLAFIVTLSYFLSGVYQLSENFYFNLVFYDLATLLVIALWVFLFDVKTFPAFYYIFIGLTCNATLAAAMYYDIYILQNREPWLLWSVYSFGTNIIDILMVLALVFNQNYLFFKSSNAHLTE